MATANRDTLPATLTTRLKKLTRTLMAYLMMICFVITLSHCVKENDSPRWDVEILGPVFQASLGINQLVKDSLLVHDDGGRVRLVYEGQWNDFTTDSVYVIPDTSINTLYVWPFFPLTIAPNTPFYTNNKDLVLNVRGAQLTEAIILSGKIRVTARNILPTKINFVYSVPEARKNGVSLSLQRSVGPGSSSSPGFFSEDIDFTGYTLNLTGALNNTVNTIAYNVVARTDSTGNSIQVVQGDTMVNLTTTLLSLTPQYVRGYLGQKDILENSALLNGIGNVFDGGELFLDSASLDLDIENRIGADLQAYIFGMNSVNTRTGLSVPLAANSVLARNLDISRGVETGIAGDPVRPSHLPLRLDASNSNISQFLQNLPDRIESDWRIRLNPLGNISGSNDFVYRDQLITAKTRLEIPFRLAMNQLSLRDTLELSESGRTSWGSDRTYDIHLDGRERIPHRPDGSVVYPGRIVSRN